MALSFLLWSLALVVDAVKDWPQFGRTPDYHSYTDVGDSSAVGEEWTFNAKDRMVGSPAVLLGRVWIGSDDGHMYCLNKSTGEIIWSYAVPEADSTCQGNEAEHGLCRSTKVRSSPAVDGMGSVIFGSYDFNVYKLDLEGNLLWKFATNGSIFGPVTLDHDGTVFIGSFDNHLYALNGTTGTAKWATDVQAHADSTWSVSQDLVFGLSNEGGLCTQWPPDDCPWPVHTPGGFHCFAFAIRKSTGEVVWKQYTGKPSGGGMYVQGTFYGGSWTGHFVAYDAETGTKKWSFDAGGMIESHPAYHDGVVFVSTEVPASAVYALNATTGEQIWKYTGASEELNGSPSVDRDTVYVGANDKYLHALDRSTGALKFKFKTCANVFPSAAIDDDGRVYIACNTVTGGKPWVGLGAAYAINPKKHLTMLPPVIQV